MALEGLLWFKASFIHQNILHTSKIQKQRCHLWSVLIYNHFPQSLLALEVEGTEGNIPANFIKLHSFYHCWSGPWSRCVAVTDQPMCLWCMWQESEDLTETHNTLIADMVNWLNPLVHWDGLIGNVKSSGSFAFVMYGAYFGFSPASRQPTHVWGRSEISAAGHLAFPDVAVFLLPIWSHMFVLDACAA